MNETPPPALVDGLRELLARWRFKAKNVRPRNTDDYDPASYANEREADMLEGCANELDPIADTLLDTLARLAGENERLLARCEHYGLMMNTAACDEYRARLSAAEAELARVREAAVEYDRLRDSLGSCGDGGCLVKRPVGMHTNGGCKCPRDPIKTQRMMHAGQQLRASLAANPPRSHR